MFGKILNVRVSKKKLYNWIILPSKLCGMRKVISGTCIILLISLYLVVPFKSQFLSTLHIISHISLHQDPNHHHNHHFNDHDHHHGLLARISITFEEQHTSEPLPENISEYKFEQPFPVELTRVAHAQSNILVRNFYRQNDHVLSGPFFEVPTPPP